MTMLCRRVVFSSLLFSLLATSQAVELTKDTWDNAVAGKAVFAKFLYVEYGETPWGPRKAV